MTIINGIKLNIILIKWFQSDTLILLVLFWSLLKQTHALYRIKRLLQSHNFALSHASPPELLCHGQLELLYLATIHWVAYTVTMSSLPVLRLRVLRSRCWQGWHLVRPPSLGCLSCVLTGPFPDMYMGKGNSAPLYKTTNPIGLGHTLMIPFNLKYLIKKHKSVT